MSLIRLQGRMRAETTTDELGTRSDRELSAGERRTETQEPWLGPHRARTARWGLGLLFCSKNRRCDGDGEQDSTGIGAERADPKPDETRQGYSGRDRDDERCGAVHAASSSVRFQAEDDGHCASGAGRSRQVRRAADRPTRNRWREIQDHRPSS